MSCVSIRASCYHVVVFNYPNICRALAAVAIGHRVVIRASLQHCMFWSLATAASRLFELAEHGVGKVGLVEGEVGDSNPRSLVNFLTPR